LVGKVNGSFLLKELL